MMKAINRIIHNLRYKYDRRYREAYDFTIMTFGYIGDKRPKFNSRIVN